MRLNSRRERGHGLLALALALSACGADYKSCPSMGPSELVKKATLLRLDVYGAGAACNGATLAANAPAPSQTSIVGPGDAIKIKVPSGHHVLLLSAYADSAGAQLLGSACSETDLKANEPACFNLALLPAAGISCDHNAATDSCPVGSWCGPDNHCASGCRNRADCPSATPYCIVEDHRCVACTSASDCTSGQRCSPAGACVDGCDLAAGAMCPSPQMCCGQLCIDVNNGDLLNCGACGRACANGSEHGALATTCVGSLCKPTCSDGWADCATPGAPTADDGCETNIHDPKNCGACRKECMLDHAVATCPSGQCKIDKCETGYISCDGMDENGCECTELKDTSRGCCPTGGCEYTHKTGFTDIPNPTYISCTPTGEHSAAAAVEAARAFDPNNSNIVDKQCGTPGNQQTKCNKTDAVCACFTYADNAGGNYVGRARRTFSNGSMAASCGCPLGTLGPNEVLWDQ